MSLTPASWSRRLTAGDATKPVPRGAGMSCGNVSGLVMKMSNGASTYTNSDGSTLAALLRWDGVRITEVGAPVATTNWHDRELGDDDGSANGSCDFLGCLDSEANVTFAVSDNDNGLEASALTSTSLLLHWLDLFNNISTYVHNRR